MRTTTALFLFSRVSESGQYTATLGINSLDLREGVYYNKDRMVALIPDKKR